MQTLLYLSRAISEIYASGQTDRQTDRQTNRPYFVDPLSGRSNKKWCKAHIPRHRHPREDPREEIAHVGRVGVDAVSWNAGLKCKTDNINNGQLPFHGRNSSDMDEIFSSHRNSGKKNNNTDYMLLHVLLFRLKMKAF